MESTLTLDTITLASGGHASPADGLCVMEAAAYFAREPHSDRPACVSPVIAAFLRSWNDALSTADRNRLLKPYVLRVIGTRTTTADEETRAWLATDWLVRVQTPAWLRLAGLEAEAQALASLARITDATTARGAQPTLNEARSRAAAAWAAAGDAARAAAMDAARAVAKAAAGARLAPVVAELQASALGLLDAMIAVGAGVPATEQTSTKG